MQTDIFSFVVNSPKFISAVNKCVCIYVHVHVLIISLRQFDSKGIIMYYVASEGLCHDVLMTKLRLRCIFPRAKLSEMRM